MYESLFNLLGESSILFVMNTVERVSDVVIKTLGLSFILYVVFYGYKLMQGKTNEPVNEGLMRMFKFIALFVILDQGTHYLDFVINVVWKSPDYLASLISGGTSGGSSDSAFLDGVRDDMMEISARLSDTGRWKNMKPWLVSIGIDILTVLSTAYAFFLYAMAKIMLAVLIGVGPFFVAMYLFEATKKFTEAWIAQLANFLVLYVLITAVLMLLSTIIKTSISGALAGQSISMADIVQPVVFLIVTWLVMLQLPSFASALGGGVALSTLGAGAFATRIASKNALTRGVGRGLGKGTKAAGGLAWKGAKKVTVAGAKRVFRRKNKVKKV